MSGTLQELLNAKEPIFSLAVRQLEAASGHEGRDVRLIAEIAGQMRVDTQVLGLDPDDTSGRELYAAQMVRIAEDNSRLTALIGIGSEETSTEVTSRVVAFVQELELARECWVLKRSVAKKMLRTMPPKGLMKLLGHRSVDSLLKHENIDELYAALRFSESDRWLSAYNELLITVTPSDFESREISLIVLNADKYAVAAERFLRERLHPIVHAKEMGVIGFVPVPAGRMRGLVLTSLALILHYIHEIRVYSAFFKLKQVQPDFGDTVVRTLNTDPANAAEMAGQYVHWRVIHQYFGGTGNGQAHPEEFEPHIQPEDLDWLRTEELLAALCPEMKFWISQEYVGKSYDGHVLTFNLLDLALAYSNSTTFDAFRPYHFQQSLWNELLVSYMGSKNLRERVLNQLDNDSIAPEALAV